MDKKPIEIKCEKTPTGFWTYDQRSAGELPTATLSKLLNWILEQMNFGHWIPEHQAGDVVSLIVGKRASMQTASCDEAIADAKNRLFAVDIARVMAEARESGIEPQYDDLSKRVSREIGEWGERNTEFHYAFELTKVLGRLNKKTFKLVAPPIAGIAPDGVRSYLKESTRCWMYGFHGASIALSRACLEEVLKRALYPGHSNRAPELDELIQEADQKGKLDGCLIDTAHFIRKTGNRFLHGEPISETDSRDALDGIRSIAEQLFSA